MDGFLNKVIEKIWLKYTSIPVLAVIVALSCISFAPNKWNEANMKFYIAASLFVIVFIGYVIICIHANTLPKAKKGNWAVLFVVDAESDQLFSDVRKKLISSFFDCINCNTTRQLQALCIRVERVRKLNLSVRDDVLSLLQATNCIFYVIVKYRVDSLINAENFEIKIDYGVVHPEFEKTVKQLLENDMGMLGEPLKKKRFTKAQTLDVFDITAHTLSLICQYVLGLVLLFSGGFDHAYSLFKMLYTELKKADVTETIKRMQQLVSNRFYITCLSIVVRDMDIFYMDKSLAALDDMNIKLDEANLIVPNTYLYNLNKAYYHVARNTDISSAKKCIDKCKQMNQLTNWRYSDAFFAAYDGIPPLSIYKKYCQAFKSEQNLYKIVDFIEYFIEREPGRITLHLAAGLVYDVIGDTILAKEHFEAYLNVEKDNRIRAVLTRKMKNYPGESIAEYAGRECA